MIILNNKNSKNEKPNFVLNDVIKRKILDMYKISKDDPQNTAKTKKTEHSTDKSQDN